MTSDSDLASKILGSWAMPTRASFSPRITLHRDGTFKVVLSSRKALSKILDLLEGDQYEGTWHISDNWLRLNYTSLPRSPLNIDLGIIKLPLANMMNAIANLFRDDRLYHIKSVTKTVAAFEGQSWHRISESV